MKKNKTMKPFVNSLKTMRSAGFNKIVWAILLSALFSNGAFAFVIGAKLGLTCGGLTLKPSCTTAQLSDKYEEVHQLITNDALHQLDVAYTIPASGVFLVRFGSEQIKEIQDGNWQTDQIQIPALHFDDEFFSRSEQRLERWQSKISAKLKQPSVMDKTEAKDLRESFGTYLHTLQDFFSHSSWVNTHPTAHDVPKFWMISENLKPTVTDPCPDKVPVYANGILTGYINDTTHLAPGNPFTSGYAGSFSELLSAKAPAGKCAHGFIGNGIHKDWKEREFHNEARAQAVYATAEAAKFIINDSENTPDNVCMFMTNHPCGTKLTTTVIGGGEVFYNPVSISLRSKCDSGTSPCTEFFDTSNNTSGSSVTLTATPTAGYKFTGWSGPDAGSCPAPAPGGSTGTCAITMDGKEKNITANFDRGLANGLPTCEWYVDAQSWDQWYGRKIYEVMVKFSGQYQDMIRASILIRNPSDPAPTLRDFFNGIGYGYGYTEYGLGLSDKPTDPVQACGEGNTWLVDYRGDPWADSPYRQVTCTATQKDKSYQYNLFSFYGPWEIYRNYYGKENYWLEDPINKKVWALTADRYFKNVNIQLLNCPTRPEP